MNALRAPLTALYVSNRREFVFSVDSADAFIDGGDTTAIADFASIGYVFRRVNECG